MKNFINYIKESQDDTKFIENLSYITNFEKSLLINILKGIKSVGYHGTNRNFKKFDLTYAKEWRAETFHGTGIFLTPDKDVAEMYANAEANKELPITLLDDVEKIDKDLATFMKGLYYKGNIIWDDRVLIEKIYTNKKFNGVDPNDIAELVNLIPGSQSYKDYHKNEEPDNFQLFNIFSNTSSALDYYHIEYLEKLGLGDYNPKVYTVKIHETNSVLLTNSVSKVKKSKHDIIIVYGIPNLIFDKPEIIVKNINLLEIIEKENV